MRSTQKPLSALWNVTRSTVPASTAVSGWGEGSGAGMGWSIVLVRLFVASIANGPSACAR